MCEVEKHLKSVYSHLTFWYPFKQFVGLEQINNQIFSKAIVFTEPVDSIYEKSFQKFWKWKNFSNQADDDFTNFYLI